MSSIKRFLALAVLGLGGFVGGQGEAARAAPAPPPPPPSGNFIDAEYRRSPWLGAANALPAFEAGASGRGVTIAIIDSGVDAASPDLAPRVVLADTSRAVDGHGTSVALIAAASRSGRGVLGVAFAANVLSYNTLTCRRGDCFHSIDAVAAAVDDAVLRGARVINLSQVAPKSRPPLFEALRRATDAGVVVVIAAGNGGSASPNGFALQNAQRAGSGLLIIAGAHGADRRISRRADRAGAGAQWYLAAYGPEATSFSTPVISGAVALLASAYPRLSGADIVRLLMTNADDAGEPGRDRVFGNGILNIGRAFEQARATVAGGGAEALAR